MDPDVESWVAEFEATADRSPDAMCLRGSDGHVSYVNAACSELIGAYDSLEVAKFADYVFGYVDDAHGPVRKVLESGESWSGDTGLTHLRTGDSVPVWVSAYEVTGRHALIPVIAMVCRDLRVRFEHERRWRRAAEAASAHAREQRAVADLSRIALTASPSEVLAQATDTAVEMVGMKCAVILEPRFPDRSELIAVSYSGPDTPPRPLPIERPSHAALVLRSGEAVVCTDSIYETRFPTEFMSARGVRSGAAVVIEGFGEPWGVLAVYGSEPKHFQDAELAFLQTVAGVVSAAIRRHDLENELRRRSLHDPLTGLPNRVLIRQRIESIRHQGNPYPIAVLVIDLDNFKMINDTLGHAAGDRTLQLVADALAGAAEPQDTVSRFGGDEFVVLHRGSNAPALAARILRALSVSFDIDGYEVTVAASIGVAVDNHFRADPDELFRSADSAMYRAKRSGNSGFAVFGDEFARSAVRSDVENDFEFEE
ncbi:diguanylate cyclase [Rhodococcus sp. G-MC3]|uniref:diguanylate cyclase domain-containing protein n=1 Tax=Rhodococcus sp. G-MC3 TaxID=3046209 RepID=UPI0024B90A40|nr:diguanylate cyclase [Rhodococcus sp. G-MC3]MDJ0393419.1 diguanylate cyclase [Rhodococcus sp. G-MC3]